MHVTTDPRHEKEREMPYPPVTQLETRLREARVDAGNARLALRRSPRWLRASARPVRTPTGQPQRPAAPCPEPCTL